MTTSRVWKRLVIFGGRKWTSTSLRPGSVPMFPWALQLSSSRNTLQLCRVFIRLFNSCNQLKNSAPVSHAFLLDLYSMPSSSQLLWLKQRGYFEVPIKKVVFYGFRRHCNMPRTWIDFSETSFHEAHNVRSTCRGPSDCRAPIRHNCRYDHVLLRTLFHQFWKLRI